MQPERYMPEPQRDDSSILGSRLSRPTERRLPVRHDGPPDAFALFCAYHLGITAEDGYQRPHPEEVARRYGMSCDELRKRLAELGLDDSSVRKVRFDLEGAQMDIRVAPEGISRTEIARDLYQDYLAARES